MDLVFERDKFHEIFNSFQNKKEKLKWAEDLIEELEHIYRNYDDLQLEELDKVYDFSSNNKILNYRSNYELNYERNPDSKFRYLLIYMGSYLIPGVNKYLAILKSELYYENKRELIKENKLSDDEKYPVFEYKYSEIKIYCDKMFDSLSEKIEYYNYVNYKFTKNYVEGSYIFDYYLNNPKDQMIILKEELKMLERKYQLEKDRILFKQAEELNRTRITDNKKLKRGKNENTEFFKNYFKCATKINGIPKNTELATLYSNKTIWCRKLSDLLFLVQLNKKIERKLESKVVKKETRELYVTIKLHIDSLIEKQNSSEYKKTGQVNIKNKGYNENIFDGDEDFNSNYSETD
ncbi:MAG: hypothetical protein ACOYN6_15960 [Ignavibacteria bacterium]